MSTQTDIDTAEATTLLESIRSNQTSAPDESRHVLETTQGNVISTQVTAGFVSLTPVDQHYTHPDTRLQVVVEGVSIFKNDTESAQLYRIVVLLRRMRRANKLRAMPIKPKYRDI